MGRKKKIESTENKTIKLEDNKRRTIMYQKASITY